MSQLLYPASYSPLLLQTQIRVPPAGEMGVADPTKLENPFQGPMWLDEIRFRIPQTEGQDLGQQWSSVFCKLFLGEMPITQGNVPISLLGKALNDLAETGVAAVGAGMPYIFTWKLPKPLFIPAREYLKPVIYFAPYAGAASLTVTVCYACRPLPVGTPTPSTLQIPFVAAFVPPMLATATVDQVDESQPSDLYNPWQQDLHVQRFVGRLMLQGDTGEEGGFMGLASITPNLQAGLSTVATGTLVSAQDSQNNILIRDPTPFAHVFDFVDRSWTINGSILPSKGFYQFTVERLWSQYAGGTTGTVGISMVGWREVNYQP